MTEISFSNSLIKSWWRVLKHQWLFLNTLDTLRQEGRTPIPDENEPRNIVPNVPATSGPRQLMSDAADEAPFENSRPLQRNPTGVPGLDPMIPSV